MPTIKMKGICRICGENKKLTFEHVPPESAFNSSPMYMQKHYHLHDKESFLYGKRHRLNRGAGGYFLCKSCNNLTGSWYGESYKKFAHFGIVGMMQRVYSNKFMPFEYSIQPLNIMKQIFSMFMAIDSSGRLLKLNGLKEFVLEKKSQLLPNDLRLFVYYTSSITVRNGWASVMSDGIFHELGEITFRPFGLVYTLDSNPVRGDFLEITNFHNYNFNQTANLRLAMPYLLPKMYIPGLYLD